MNGPGGTPEAQAGPAAPCASPSAPVAVTQDTASGVLPAPGRGRLDRTIAAARDWLLARQDRAGFWCGELEGDTTLESYVILLEAFFGRPRSPKALALATVIREEVLPDGGWAQYPTGPAEVSVSCLSYFALRIAGDAADAPHMRRSRDAIARLGGVERANTYTKYHLALFGQYSWARVPAIPPEMVFLPRLSPFTVYDMSSWSRTIFVPLSILYAAKPVRPLPAGTGIDELRADAPRSGGDDGAADGSPAARGAWRTLFFWLDRLLKAYERVPGAARLRSAAVERAAAWMVERLAHSDGLSAILPAMANSVMALDCLGYGPDHPLMREQLGHLDGLLLEDEAGGLRMQPCLSPVWDTVLASHALGQADVPPEHPGLRLAVSWLLSRQCRLPGDWSHRNSAPPGGWYFEHRNEFYPDVDDTCMALMVLRRNRPVASDAAHESAIARGLAWMLGMQNDDGGWGSFDRNNDKQWLTHVPFADHNAMIDPSTADITARVLECLADFPGMTLGDPVVERAVRFLRRDQCTDGSWYGRWGVNYLYGTWQVLRGLRAIGEDMQAPYVRRAVRWVLQHQNGDGGWGESIASYADPAQKAVGSSTPSQTAWGLMAVLAGGGDASGGEVACEAAARRGARFLLDRQTAEGTWEQRLWTGTGFPKVFYLNYHLYRHTFPLMALGQYRAARFPDRVADG
jgi:squalene-hopene/tetraprenyl-beta-curcumene cyclase